MTHAGGGGGGAGDAVPYIYIYMGVSKNNGIPKSSNLIGFSILNHPFWGTPIFGNIHIDDSVILDLSQVHLVSFFTIFRSQKKMMSNPEVSLSKKSLPS